MTMRHSSLLSASHIVEAIVEKCCKSRTWMTKISNPESPDNADYQALSEVLTHLVKLTRDICSDACDQRLS